MTNFIGLPKYRSLTDDGVWPVLAAKAATNSEVFSNFRSDVIVHTAFEGLTKEQGQQQLDRIKKEYPDLITRMEYLRENDEIGKPLIYDYPDVGMFCPATLRYIKIAMELAIYFNSNIGSRVVEIGVGYGGQALIIDKLFDIKEYVLMDLPPVLNLASRYLESYQLRGSYKTKTLNQTSEDEKFDCVISNFAFSELSSSLQLMYIKKILSKSKRGFLTMNSGLNDSVYHKDKVSLKDLKYLLPPFEVFEENPLTAHKNYVIIWGHKGETK